MTIKRITHLASSVLAVLTLMYLGSCSDSDKPSYEPYDPNKPVTLTNFYPTTGGVATKVILNGENFGNEAEKIKVFFNNKEAAVIEAIGDKIYAICPRKPGDGDENNIVHCKVAVEIGG